MIERGVCCACAYELMKPINNEGTAVSSYGVPKVKSKGCLSCRLAGGTPRGPHILVAGGDLSAHRARFAEHRQHFGQIRAHGCHFFILPQLCAWNRALRTV